MNIATRVIEIVGGADKVSEITGVHVSQVHRWKWPKDRGGTDGRVPTQHQQTILDYARANKKALTPADFFDPIDEAATKSKTRAGGKSDSHTAPSKTRRARRQRECDRPNHQRQAAG